MSRINKYYKAIMFMNLISYLIIMFVLYNYLRNRLSSPPSRLFIKNFIEERYITDDTWNKHVNGEIKLEYFLNNQSVGYIDYRIKTGQIGLFFIEDKYSNRGLGKQILNKVIDELKVNNVKEVWAVTRDDHPFWSNVFNKSFTPRKPVHPCVTGSGYYMKIKETTS